MLPEVLMKVNKIPKLLNNSYILLGVDFPVAIYQAFLWYHLRAWTSLSVLFYMYGQNSLLLKGINSLGSL